MYEPVIDLEKLTDNEIHMGWSPLTTDLETGALQILSYSLEWAQG
jgi:hypothetical protein